MRLVSGHPCLAGQAGRREADVRPRGGLQRRTARPAVRARRLLARRDEVPEPLWLLRGYRSVL